MDAVTASGRETLSAWEAPGTSLMPLAPARFDRLPRGRAGSQARGEGGLGDRALGGAHDRGLRAGHVGGELVVEGVGPVISGTGPRTGPTGPLPRTAQEIVTGDAPADDASWPPTR
jgi:hypothetical protein